MARFSLHRDPKRGGARRCRPGAAPPQPSELVGRAQLAVEAELRCTLSPAVAHHVGDFWLAAKERLETLLVGPLVDDEHLVVAAGEGVPHRTRGPTGVGDAPHHVTAGPGSVPLKICGVSLDPHDRDYRHVPS